MVSGKKSTLLTILVLLVAVPAVSIASSTNYNKNFTAAIDLEILNSPAVLLESLYAGTEFFHPHAAVLMLSISLLFISFFIDHRFLPVTLRNLLWPEQNQFHSSRQLTPNIPNKYVQQKSLSNKFQQELDRKRVPNITKSHFSSLFKPALILVAPRAEQKITFSPGFIFVRLARGPPNLTCEKILTFTA